MDKLRKGEWQSLLFQDGYSKIRLAMGPRTKSIDIFIKKKFYNPGPKRDLRPVFEELVKGITPDKLSSVSPSSSDEAGILKAYTERRGIMAVLKLEKEKYQREAFDVSYEFRGYDVKSNVPIEVKAFRNSSYKPIQLTQNEYQALSKEENYQIYVVEEAWDNIPKISIISEPRKLLFVKQSKDAIETRITSQEYFECGEDRWRSKVTKTDHVEL